MEENETIERLSKKTFDGKCPYCQSTNTYKGFTSYAAGPSGNSNKYPEANIEVWHCSDCKRVFELF